MLLTLWISGALGASPLHVAVTAPYAVDFRQPCFAAVAAHDAVDFGWYLFAGLRPTVASLQATSQLNPNIFRC